MSDETILLPCPFCGGEAHVIVSSDGYGVECWGELCTKNQLEEIPTEAEAIAAWNTRAPVEYEGWFYLPKPKNSLVHYGTPQIEKMENGYKAKQPVEIIESAIRAWGDELGEHIMKRICEVWNTRTHGTLTAEQVRECVQHVYHEGYSDGSVRRGAHIDETDWQAIADELNAETGSEINGDTSDGYHTFNELYHHRAVLFSVVVRDHRELAWKARKHHDGTMYDGMFIVGIETPKGQATYHYDLDPYWEIFDCEEREYAPKWDGHTPDEAIARIAELGSGMCEFELNTDMTAIRCDKCGYELPAGVSLSKTKRCGGCGRWLR